VCWGHFHVLEGASLWVLDIIGGVICGGAVGCGYIR